MYPVNSGFFFTNNYLMHQDKIHFHSEEIEFELKNQKLIKDWVLKIIENHSKELGDLNYIFCSDEYLLKINKEHLDHDYYTDIITFDYCENDVVSGDLFLSVDRISENAKTFGKTQLNELNRVIAHGLLHLLGFKDKTDQEANEMRSQEDAALNLLTA